ncbi:MAG TPA: succinylglutamate-semialdehyde dehydrogenase [Parachlamydiaceae bacterium]|nr:succinylglutamate-semialdehyde dehydrogenase [Parachlamydiaceae bacterium]
MNSNNCHFINGQWVSSKSLLGASTPSLISRDPASGNTIWQGYPADKEIVDQAIMAAKKAFPLWSSLELNQRASYLEMFREALLKSKSYLAEIISQSTGKPLWEAATEVTAMANKITISMESYQARCPESKKQQPQGMSITTHRAHGVMAVLGPYNFPGHLPNGHIIPALLAGNTIVFKPSELAPLVAEATLKCWESCNLPPGVINMVQGSRDIGQLLSEHEDIDGLLFTGSWNTGRHLAELMAKTPYKILALEMGGNNPLVIGKITDFKAAAYLTIQSAFLTAGQRCTCARRLIVPKGSTGDHFVQVLIGMIKTIQVGSYNDKPEPFMGPVITNQAADILLTAQEKLIGLGAVPLIPLARMEKSPAFLSPGLIDVTQVANLPDEEYFGPFLQIIRVDNFKVALETANRTKYGLVAGLLSDDPEEYQIFFKTIKAGVINWNTSLTGASSAAPFGGIGQSGNNRPSAFYAADYCAYPIASLVSDQLIMPNAIHPGIQI